MKPLGRRAVALVGIAGAIALWLSAAPAGFADTLKIESELTTKEIGSKDNALGQALADALRKAAKTDLAFIAASYLTADFKLPKGNAKTEDVLKALEYRSDGVLVVKLTGAQILRALEHGLSLYPKSNSGFLQVSGLTATLASGENADKRVLAVKVDGAALEPGKTYRVAMPAPLANGALAYFRIWKKSDIEKESEKALANVTLESALSDYLKESKAIGKGDDRLVVKEK